jgi:hypothetical protein
MWSYDFWIVKPACGEVDLVVAFYFWRFGVCASISPCDINLHFDGVVCNMQNKGPPRKGQGPTLGAAWNSCLKHNFYMSGGIFI